MQNKNLHFLTRFKNQAQVTCRAFKQLFTVCLAGRSISLDHRNTLEAINNEMFLVNDDVVLWLHGDNRLGKITRFSWG